MLPTHRDIHVFPMLTQDLSMEPNRLGSEPGTPQQMMVATRSRHDRELEVLASRKAIVAVTA